MSRTEREQSPIEPRRIALASARREYVEVEESAALEAQMRGAVYTPQASQKKEQTIKQIAVRNEQLLRVRNNKAAATEIKRVQMAEGLDAVSAYSDEELQMSPENKLQFEKRMNRMYVDFFMEPTIDDSTRYHFKEFDEAEQLAKERYTDIDTVYEDEQLYGEVVRRTYKNPQTHAEFMIGPAVDKDLKRSAAKYQKAFVGFRAAIILVEHGTPPEEAQRHGQQLVDSFDHNPELQSSIDTFVDGFRRGHYIAAEEEVRKYWGEEGVQSLSPTIQHAIAYYKEEMEDALE